MISALAYLVRTSTRNMIAERARRLRSPRYAVALALGLGYLWLVYFRRSSEAMQPDIAPPVMQALSTLAPVALMFMAAWYWVFGADRKTLAFTEAEVSMLFTAPLSRRALVGYKLARTQVPVFTTSLLWTLILYRDHPGAGAARFASFWLVLSTLSFHRLGVGITRASQREHGIHGVRRAWLPMLAFAALALTTIGALVGARGAILSASGPRQSIAAIVHAVSTVPASWSLAPFRLVLAPVFAPLGAAWSAAMLPALAIFLVHVWWVVRTDAAFEEAAVEASEAQAARLEISRARRGGSGAVLGEQAKRSLPLASHGPPAWAIVWKNYLWLIRTGQLRGLLLPPVVALAAVLACAGRYPLLEVVLGVLCATLAAMMLAFGPITIRNDLRNDLLNLPMLKSLPLSGRQIVMAEVTSSASAVALNQFLMLVVGMLAFSQTDHFPFQRGRVLEALVMAPLLLLSLNTANFTIHNGMALLYPGWVRLGDAGSAGIEAMGQVMLTVGATMLMLFALLVLPAAVAVVAWLSLSWHGGAAIALCGALAGVMLAVESYLLMRLLGGALERVEPMHIG